MRYPIMIEAGDHNTAWSVVVPDLPGCYSAGDTLDDAIMAAEEAAAAWIDAALDAGQTIPAPSQDHEILKKDVYNGWRIDHVFVHVERMLPGINR
ncbi:type II toxin-antitoxin system HicB family antitoxin [Stenotrophomonas oahuensis]|uniref:Type II toxin-antitoxin system HicB family antitoxin n=1 Tax=Stenotrophomonas oahuensis TaxID=3003271 RepID=A0ABY9YS82_9GAMM|nr:type II toxin-antitoxin system HicB family antitoxin [Stenotrophomonas sp. A5586]WNH53039.1 type II toxin-antitoxin system HicB family antitoxin [Stenotrophomonas sp. A5586]